MSGGSLPVYALPADILLSVPDIFLNNSFLYFTWSCTIFQLLVLYRLLRRGVPCQSASKPCSLAWGMFSKRHIWCAQLIHQTINLQKHDMDQHTERGKADLPYLSLYSCEKERGSTGSGTGTSSKFSRRGLVWVKKWTPKTKLKKKWLNTRKSIHFHTNTDGFWCECS